MAIKWTRQDVIERFEGELRGEGENTTNTTNNTNNTKPPIADYQKLTTKNH
jgi:hypothetical protein